MAVHVLPCGVWRVDGAALDDWLEYAVGVSHPGFIGGYDALASGMIIV
jgi:hypothetical protein